MADTGILEGAQPHPLRPAFPGLFDSPAQHHGEPRARRHEKSGSGFDLPIAIAILAASNQIPRAGLDDALLVGELALDGSVCPVRGEVAYQLLARRCAPDARDGAKPDHVPLEGVAKPVPRPYRDAARRHRRGLACVPIRKPSRPHRSASGLLGRHRPRDRKARPGDRGGRGARAAHGRKVRVRQDHARQAHDDDIAAHRGSTSDRRRCVSIRLPERTCRPFGRVSVRFAHRITASRRQGLVGGGRPVRPGEISLALGGILFLDELAEFPNNVLQTLRQPLETGSVRIVRVDGAYTFPSRSSCWRQATPARAGTWATARSHAVCTPGQVLRYRSKLSGPLADRIDITSTWRARTRN